MCTSIAPAGLVRFALALAAAALPRTTTEAQRPRDSETLTPAAVAESLAVLRALDAAVRSDPANAAAWHRRGMVAWVLAARAQVPPPVHGLDATRLGRLADTSLRIARSLAPDSVRYAVMSQRYVVATNWGPMRWLARRALGDAWNPLGNPLDPADFAHAAIAEGYDYWARYDTFRDLRIPVGDVAVGRSVSDAMFPASRYRGDIDAFLDRALEDWVKFATQSPTVSLGGGGEGTLASKPGESVGQVRATLRTATLAPPPGERGEADYARADTLFRAAYAAEPTHPRAFRAYAMLLADRARWRELEALARTHSALQPGSGEARMTLGLALQRTHRSGAARAVFDSALALFPEPERERLTAVERVLSPAEADVYRSLGASERAMRARGFWMRENPQWGDANGDLFAEFLARVWYAELRWSVDERHLRGADTDRGDIYVRYGPPDTVAAVGAKPESTQDADIVTFWLYNNGLVFAFAGKPTFRTAYVPLADARYVAAIRSSVPVRWDNIGLARVDSMLVQVARFRARGDSVTIVLAAAPPVATIAASSDVRQPVRTLHWLLENGVVPVHTSAVELDAPRVLSWQTDVRRGSYLYRVEAGATGATRGAAAMAVVAADTDPATGFSHSGFGTSDVWMVKGSAELPPRARWTEAGGSPLAGAVERGTAVDVVWENYEFGNDDGVARYAVTVTLTGDASAAGRLAMQIVGVPPDRVRADRSGSRVAIAVERAVPYAPTFADRVRIALGDSPAGSYLLTLTVQDKTTGRTGSTSTKFVIW